ncbi:MAG: transglutaminase-like domain-containing protein [Desulfobacterota bacterium]|nr:transglutaminase-like domain-containing protein [Thermodesulfobacteriota bacterium]
MKNLPRFRPYAVLGLGFLSVFTFLLMLRLGVLEPKGKGGPSLSFTLPSGPNREIWMQIFQHDRRIGYAHRQFFEMADGFRVQETVSLRMNILGLVQDLRFRMTGDLNHRLGLSGFDFELQSGLVRFRARGGVQGRTLAVSCGPTGSEEYLQIPLDREVHLPVGLLESLKPATMRVGDRRSFEVFDPLTLSRRSVRLTVVAEETIEVMDRREKAKKVSVDWMGSPQVAWIGEDGSILREEGSLGLRLERTTREEAIQGGGLSLPLDLAEVASVPVSRVLPEPSSLNLLRIRLEGIEAPRFFLHGGRQAFRNGILTVRREDLLRPPPNQEREGGGDLKDFLKPSPFIQSDHPEILAQARAILSQEDSDLEKGRKLVLWVHQNIRRQPVFSIPNALETLRKRVGDCNEHAVLLAALARAAGLPAEVEAGLVYQNGRFYYHAWNVLYLGRWVTADATLNQLPADVTHLRFVRGAARQIDLAGMIGKIRLTILE